VKRQWAESTRKHQRAASGAATPSTVGLGLRAVSSHGRFTQITRKLRAERRKAGKDRMIADVFHGDAKRNFVEVLELWAQWINKQVGPKTTDRYACSLDQMRPWLDGKELGEIDSRIVAEIVRARSGAGVTNATIKRDLVALSSVLNFAIDQGWL